MASNDWLVPRLSGQPQAGGPMTGGGGTPQTDPLVGYRDILDAKRNLGSGFTPNAEYPDGYLGNVRSRQNDKLFQTVQSRLTQRSYQRGVHKGERIDPSDYFWPESFNPDTALRAEARGYNWTASGATLSERVNHMGKQNFFTPGEIGDMAQQYDVRDPNAFPGDARRLNSLRNLLPAWR